MRLLAMLLLLPGVLAAQQPTRPPAPSDEQVIRAIAQEVLLDIVVRDKRGRLVQDLKPAEIEVYDDGARQELTSFRLVTGSDAAGLGSGSEAEGPRQADPMRYLRLVSLVYEGLDNESRRLARQACLDLLKDDLEQNVYVAVFVIGDRLQVLQPFTNDLGLLRKAVDRATTSHYPQLVAESQAVRRQLEVMEQQGALAAQAAALNMPGPGTTDTSGLATAATAGRMAQVALNMLNFEEFLTRTQQSRSSLFSILSLVVEQAALPGRKTVVYFTRGLQVPENMVERFRDTIGAANRAGVSFYGVDARGLTLDSQNTASISMLNSAVIASRRQQTVTEAAVTPEQVKVFDTALSSIHANTQQALGDLSASTGGFMIANTNDLGEPLLRVREDILTYYEVAYVPPITEYDGRFHKLTVKVNRPDVRIQTRSGYFALPPDRDSIFAYEAPLLHALSQSSLPRTIPYHAGAVKFGEENGRIRHSLIVEVPLKDLKATEEKENNRYLTRLSVLMLLKDQRGGVVERFSHDFPFQIPSDKLEEFRKRQFLKSYEVRLPPGRYVLESAVADREGNQASARRVSVMVTPPRPGVAMSGISLIRRMDPWTEDAGVEEAFHFQENRVVPTLDNSVHAVPGSGCSFYFVVYPSPEGSEKPELAIELSRDGVALGSVSPELPAANERGEIPYIASLPLDGFQPGQYELRAVVRQGSSAAEERTVFTIVP